MPDRRIKGARTRSTSRVDREIPINLERIMLRAVGDETFRALLVEDPVRAASDGGFELKGTEEAMLAAMDRATIEAMVRRFEAPRARGSGFARGVAAAVAGSMIISVSACGEGTSKGVGPDPPDGVADSTDPVPEVADAADPLPDVYEEPDADVAVDTPHEGSFGVLPDMPEDVEDDG